MPSLAIVIISWNVRELLRRCLVAVEQSLAGSGIDYQTIVVDNASADGSPEMVRADFPQVRLIEAGANLGFAGGNNLALRALGLDTQNRVTGRQGASELVRGRETVRCQGVPNRDSLSPCLLVSLSADYVLLLNPDTEPVGDAIPRLVHALVEHPEWVAVGPQLHYPDGSHQPSRRRFPDRATFFWESTLLERLWPANPWAVRFRAANVPDDMPQSVGWLVGAALLVRASAIARAGLLDEHFFMYSEELEWQARLQEAGGRSQEPGARRQAAGGRRQAPGDRGRIWYLPEAIVIHHEGKSSEQAIAGRHINFQRSRLLLARMWYGWRFAGLLRGFYRLTYAYELTVEAAKLLLGHRPTLRRQRIAVYWQVIRAL